MNFKPVLSVLGIIFMSILLVLATIKIWMPEYVDNDVFLKLILTFAVLSLGSMVIQMISTPAKQDKGKKEAE